MFKKFRVYNIKDGAFKGLTADKLEENLAKKPFKPCTSQQMKSFGWSNWEGLTTENLVMPLNLSKGSHFLLTLKVEERDLKAKIITEAVNKKVAEIESNESHTVTAKEKREIKENVTQELMPKALTSSYLVLVWIDLAKSRIIINETSDSKCEAPLNLLRECLGSLPAIPIATMKTPSVEMTQWVKEGVPEGFLLGDSCTLYEPMDTGNTITIKGQDLSSDEVQNHIRQGKHVKKLGLANANQAFSLDEKLVFSGIKINPEILSDLNDSLGESVEDKKALFEGTFAIFADALQQLIDQSIKHLGGVYDPNDAADPKL